MLHCLDKRLCLGDGPLFPLSPEQRHQSVLALEFLMHLASTDSGGGVEVMLTEATEDFRKAE